jgi:hypothetical protein
MREQKYECHDPTKSGRIMISTLAQGGRASFRAVVIAQELAQEAAMVLAA